MTFHAHPFPALRSLVHTVLLSLVHRCEARGVGTRARRRGRRGGAGPTRKGGPSFEPHSTPFHAFARLLAPSRALSHTLRLFPPSRTPSPSLTHPLAHTLSRRFPQAFAADTEAATAREEAEALRARAAADASELAGRSSPQRGSSLERAYRFAVPCLSLIFACRSSCMRSLPRGQRRARRRRKRAPRARTPRSRLRRLTASSRRLR